MSNDIRIDIESYERRYGRPTGKAYWTFKIISPTVTAKDKVITMDTAIPFKAACERVRRIAALRRSELIVLVPEA
ncbi:hypothetical protein [Bradyrhizobium sp. LeoA1S1]